MSQHGSVPRAWLRRIGAIALVAIALSAIGARCIENVAVRTDGTYQYLLGEIYNDTDIQGARMVVRATLFDANGNVLASKDTATCPPDLQPHGLSSYGVRFDQPGLPSPARWEVRPVAGLALEQPLPDSGVVVASLSARRQGSGIGVTYSVRNNSNLTYQNPQMCAVVYDAQGRVGSWSPFDPAEQHPGQTTLHPGQTVDLSFSLFGQSPDSATARVWLWIPAADRATSPYQPVMSQVVPVAP